MRALIIEDEYLLAWMIEDILEDLGICAVDVTCTEEAAVAAAQHHCPDLIIADSHIAQGIGVRAVQAICAHRHIPTVFVTADGASVRQVMADAIVIEKPAPTSALVARCMLCFRFCLLLYTQGERFVPFPLIADICTVKAACYSDRLGGRS